MKTLSNIKNAALYVGTYRKYNEGSLFGKWMTLSDYSDKEEFLEACRELHKDEHDPEFMFQDCENLPESFYCESYISEKYWALLEAVEDMTDEEMAIFPEWIDYRCYKMDDDTDISELVEKFNDEHCGDFSDDSCWYPLKNYAYDNAAEWLGIGYDELEKLRNYIDYDAIEREMDIEGYFEIEGHIFRPAA